MQASAGNRTTNPITKRTSSGWSRHIHGLILLGISALIFLPALSQLARLALQDENASQVLLIPLISASLIYLRRKQVFSATSCRPLLAALLLIAAGSVWYGCQPLLHALDNTDRLSVFAALLAATWIGLFLLCYGVQSFRSALFPLLFLGLMIPLPVAVASRLVSLLQSSSADTTYFIFQALGLPVLRHGFHFALPGVDIEVAQECSGIHSAISLVIAGLLAGQFLLTGIWKKAGFALCIIPIAIFKNAVRIVTIAWLGIKVNPAVFVGPIHRQGGLPFSLVALAIMAGLLWLLRTRQQTVPGLTPES